MRQGSEVNLREAAWAGRDMQKDSTRAMEEGVKERVRAESLALGQLGDVDVLEGGNGRFFVCSWSGWAGGEWSRVCAVLCTEG